MTPDDEKAEDIANRVLARFLHKEGADKTGMARATLVVDENVNFLSAALRDANFRVVEPTKGLEDAAIKETLLSHRILVTKNSKDFIEDAPVYDYGIIALEALPFVDSSRDYVQNTTVRMISKAISEYGLISERTGFILVLMPNGQHKFRRIG